MDLEVVGRHALLFDDDAAAAFVNSGDALVGWNSLLIDRYDVRHLLPTPPPPRKRRPRSPPCGSSAEAEIDHERYLDLQAAIEEEDLYSQELFLVGYIPSPGEEFGTVLFSFSESDVGEKPVEAGGYQSVAFSYGNTGDSNNRKNCGDKMGDFGFCPPFHIPESLLQCLPPTEKVHQIIARTALFVAKNGGQSEIVLRVKQGDNPTFGFLMPDHLLHPYFRYLIDHQELLKSDTDEKSENDRNLTQTTSGALSLLGSVYGSGDDEDVAIEDVSESKENESRKTVNATVSSVGHGSQETKISDEAYDKDEAFPKHSSSHKENIQVSSKNFLMKVSKAGIPNSKKKEGHLSLPSATVSKPLSSAPVNASKVEPVILEPPSDIKRLVDRVVEFILKNGPQFEAVLTEQDSKYGRFPFLVPSNQFHPYYANVLQKTQESKSSGKSFLSGKNELTVSRLEKKLSLGKESDSLSLEQARSDIPYDYDRKEKFKMVLGKSKKDSDDPHSRISPSPYGITIDAAQTAAILRAATRGVKNSTFGSFPNLSLNGEIKESDKKDQSVAVAANEAESTDGHMTTEQKLKAERLKRAKLFVSMLKSGAAPSTKLETPRGLSVEPREPVVSVREREGSSVSLDVETSVKKDESERKLSDSEILERISRRKYRSRSSRYEDDEEEENEDEEEKKNNEKRSRKKHRSHRSSRENGKEVEDDEEDRDYRAGKRKHRSHRSSRENGPEEEDDEEEDGDYRHGKRKHRSHRSSRENGKEVEDDEEDRDYRERKRKHRSHRYSRENGTEDEDDDEDGRAYRHGKRKHRSPRSLRENGKELEDDEEDRDQRHSKRKHRSHHSSHENDIEEESDEDDRDYRNGKRRHQSHDSPCEDEIEDDNRRIYLKSKKHRSHHSSDDDDREDDYPENPKKKHKSHHSSRHRRDRHKHKDRHSSSKNSESLNGRKHEKSPDDEGHPNSSSVEDLEEGEISSKISDRSRGSVGAGASREASIDVSSSFRDGRAPSQPSEASEVPDDLRAKIREMLMANL